MPTFDQVLNVNLGGLKEAVADWTDVIAKLQKLEKSAIEGLRAKAEEADWRGENAGVTLPFVRKTAKEFGDALAEATGFRNILRDAHSIFSAAKKELEAVIEEAPWGVTISPKGAVGHVHPDSVSEEYKDKIPDAAVIKRYQDRIDDAVKKATDADEVAARALLTIAGKDGNNFTGVKYDDLAAASKAQDMADGKDAADIVKKGADATATELARLNDLCKANVGDKLFATTMATEASAKGSLAFWAGVINTNQGNLDKRKEATLKDLQKNFGLTLAEATHSTSSEMQKWKEEVIKQGSRQINTNPTAETSGPYGFQVMSSLMREGEFDSKFLNQYGAALIDFEKNTNAPELWSNGGLLHDKLNFDGGKNDDGKDPMTGFLEALGHNPKASTEFFQSDERFNYLVGIEGEDGPEPRIWPLDSASHVPDPDQKKALPGFDSLGHALESATTGHAYEAGPSVGTSVHSREQAELMQKIVSGMSEKPELVRAGMGDSLGRISAEYMPDIHRALDPDRANGETLFPNNGTGASLSERDVTRFLHTVGQDPGGYAAVNLGQHHYTASIIDFHAQHPDLYVNTLSQDRSDAMKSMVESISRDAGEIEGIIGAGRDYALEEKIVDGDGEFNKALGQSGTWAGSLVGIGVGIGASPFLGPGGIVAGGLLGTATGEIINGIVEAGEKKEELGEQVFRNGASWESLKEDTGYTTRQAIDTTVLRGSPDAGLYKTSAAASVETGFGDAQSGIDKYFSGAASRMPED
ncbi:DUF6571 family protein [Streptomyces sp. NPDC051907]|uniref:DUF6571 family protein n=1 Tax=Streptomyces sp. NPDC051907 TaxID=3155284 RepID=UPI00341C18D0